jgi:hypothetical protein
VASGAGRWLHHGLDAPLELPSDSPWPRVTAWRTSGGR